ncbi:hypothetical protein SESBI_49580, partial [Sesbania bispinosa]
MYLRRGSQFTLILIRKIVRERNSKEGRNDVSRRGCCKIIIENQELLRFDLHFK